ncbi:hypothetical protein [Galbibacter mesophilus]|uniref:hypothetical protein n=1 Tax=Galbibacter mesophilus TaxID=379069 RepID=UPI00191C9773|nr:hypothetical protein [Galbibacter mesophilus]MCM5662952.1 hypothetical protein [Galbibacter mesophilus]
MVNVVAEVYIANQRADIVFNKELPETPRVDVALPGEVNAAEQAGVVVHEVGILFIVKIIQQSNPSSSVSFFSPSQPLQSLIKD